MEVLNLLLTTSQFLQNPSNSSKNLQKRSYWPQNFQELLSKISCFLFGGWDITERNQCTTPRGKWVLLSSFFFLIKTSLLRTSIWNLEVLLTKFKRLDVFLTKFKISKSYQKFQGGAGGLKNRSRLKSLLGGDFDGQMLISGRCWLVFQHLPENDHFGHQNLRPIRISGDSGGFEFRAHLRNLLFKKPWKILQNFSKMPQILTENLHKFSKNTQNFSKNLHKSPYNQILHFPPCHPQVY